MFSQKDSLPSLENEFHSDLNERITTRGSQNYFYSALMNYEIIKNFYEEETQRDFSKLENIECKQETDEKAFKLEKRNKFQINYNPRYNRKKNNNESPNSFTDSLEDDYYQNENSYDELSPQDLRPKIYNIKPHQMDCHPKYQTESENESIQQNFNKIKITAKRDIELINQSIEAERNDIDKLSSKIFKFSKENQNPNIKTKIKYSELEHSELQNKKNQELKNNPKSKFTKEQNKIIGCFQITKIDYNVERDLKLWLDMQFPLQLKTGINLFEDPQRNGVLVNKLLVQLNLIKNSSRFNHNPKNINECRDNWLNSLAIFTFVDKTYLNIVTEKLLQGDKNCFYSLIQQIKNFHQNFMEKIKIQTELEDQKRKQLEQSQKIEQSKPIVKTTSRSIQRRQPKV